MKSDVGCCCGVVFFLVCFLCAVMPVQSNPSLARFFMNPTLRERTSDTNFAGIGEILSSGLRQLQSVTANNGGSGEASKNTDYREEKCEPPRGEMCVEIRDCPFFADLLDRSSIPRPRSVIKVIRDHQCGFAGQTPKVCCFRPTPSPPSKMSSVPLTPSTTVHSPHAIFDKLTESISGHRNYRLIPVDKCGPITTNSRITSGSTAGLNEFPWMALIAYYTNDGLDFRCGGTVINERYVLTAAHCILNSTIIGVRLGEHNITSQTDCENGICSSPVQDFYIESVLVHPKYNPKTFDNDIALIRLATPANFSNENVKPICLPIGETNDDLSGKFAIVSGWGVTETGYKSPILLKVSIPVLPISTCQKIYQKFAPITSRQICAGGYQGKDSCGGDSGGPMKYVGLIDGSPRYIQYGVVSYGPRHCGTNGQPGIYTRVSSYISWILDNLQPSEE